MYAGRGLISISQKLRQLGDIRRDPPRFVACDRCLFYGPAMVTGVTAWVVIQSY
jgi:hypothetical protein